MYQTASSVGFRTSVIEHAVIEHADAASLHIIVTSAFVFKISADECKADHQFRQEVTLSNFLSWVLHHSPHLRLTVS